jgi:5-methylcytosine-specific restriction protein B
MTSENKEFTAFVEKCIMEKCSLLTKEAALFTEDNIESTVGFLKAIKPLMDKENEEARKYNKTSKTDKKKTWGISDIFDGTVFNKDSFNGKNQQLISKFEVKKDFIIQILLHCNWLMYLCSDRQHKQKSANGLYKKSIDAYFNVDMDWSIGATFSGVSMDAMLFIVELIKKLKENKENQPESTDDIINDIETICNDKEWRDSLKWEDKDEKSISSDAIVNILLYLCDSEHYLPIPAQNKKKQIYENMKDLVDGMQDDQSLEGMSQIDRNLYKIRKELLKGNALYPVKNPFWHPDILPFWNESKENLDSDQLSDETLLKYKKAMVLYGPPGTSKSYQARQIAESMIAKAIKKENRQKGIKDCIEEFKKTKDSHIHILQMHPGYIYDDFIIGKVIDNNKIAIKPGKLLKIIANINSEDKLPHFVILDEINRVDISRVFGELFTAMEPSYRKGHGVELSVDVSLISGKDKNGLNIDEDNGKLYLKVPENMYFIGTMNMIDFSLEQVDFALRRRFLWKLSTYDKNRLDEIISEKVEKGIKYNSGNPSKWREIPDNYVNCCTALNNEITWESSLGEKYLIGHAFFAEIVDIFAETKDWNKAKNVLWQISILPTLEAYCGTMDSDMQKKFIDNCKNAFLPEQKTRSKDNKNANYQQEQNPQEA